MIVAFAFALGWVIGFLTGSCFVVLIARIAVKQGKLWIVHSPSRRVPASVEVELLNSLIDTLEADNARLREQLVMAGSSETYLNGEIKRLREAIVEDCLGHEAIDPRLECECALCQIAREGR